MKKTMTMTAMLVGALALSAPIGKVKFDWKPVKGASAEYTTTNSHEANLGGGVSDIVVTWDSTITVDKVDGKRVWFQVDNEEPMVEIDGGPADGIMVRIPDQTVEHGLDFKFYPGSDDDRRNLGIYAGFLLPKGVLRAGQTYEIGGMKAKYVGTEKVKNWDAHKFTFEYSAGKKDTDLWSEGTIWLSKEDLTLVQRKVTLHNIDMGMGPEDVENEIVRTK
ncbi:MAG: hypothetical protein IH945_08230 [Armatimonadetes bacterium]|nr:hypothetical protein [Armatimonadota bacterium]